MPPGDPSSTLCNILSPFPGLPGLPGSFTQGLGLGSPPISREGRLDELNQGLVDVVVPFARAYAAKGVNVRGEAEEAAFARGRTPAVLGPDERGAAVRKLAEWLVPGGWRITQRVGTQS